MKHGLLYTMGIIILTMVLVTTSPAQVLLQPQQVPSAPGPYYATPSWDQKLPAASRFIILSDWGNAAVLDKETGLVWERSPSTSKFSWAYGIQHCITLTVGNRRGWRLPTIHELATLADTSVAVGSATILPSGHPFMNVQSSFYWSITPSVTASGYNYVMSLGNGFIGNPEFGAGIPQTFVWCVRGPQ